MNQDDQINLRINFFAVFIFFILIIYAYKLFSIQIINGEQFKNKSKNISQRVKRIPAQRGEIYDRNFNIPMVLNIDSFAVDVVPGEIKSKEFSTVISRLACILKVPVADLQRKLPPNVRKDFRTIEIKSNLKYETVVELAENIDELPGVTWRSKPMRNYVETGSFSHIIGYVGDITAEELKSFYNKGYTNNSLIGKTGIEKQYDELLRGTDGTEYRTVDVKGRYIENTTRVNPPKTGKNLILTLDRRIQKLTEKALGARIGSAVVLRPSNGEVLAMVSYPNFDQNIFIQENSHKSYAALLRDSRNPLLNRAVNARYPPASTFKVVMNTAILNEKVFPPDKKVICQGEIKYGDRLFRCHIRKPGHGHLNLKEALVKSCDIYYWTVCRDYLGIDKIIEYAAKFGFGESTQIDLPSQTSGLLPTSKWKERSFHEKWLHGDTMNMSIGQGYLLASPLQVANTACMVINNGIIYKPHLLKEVREAETNKIIVENSSEILRKENIPPEVFRQVRNAMRSVVTEGEARYPMKNMMFKLAGKTGTAEVGLHDRWHSWMLAYGPYDAKPEDMVVVAVIVEAKNKWEWWAPYAANIILQGTLANQSFDEAVEALGFGTLAGIQGRTE